MNWIIVQSKVGEQKKKNALFHRHSKNPHKRWKHRLNQFHWEKKNMCNWIFSISDFVLSFKYDMIRLFWYDYGLFLIRDLLSRKWFCFCIFHQSDFIDFFSVFPFIAIFPHRTISSMKRQRSEHRQKTIHRFLWEKKATFLLFRLFLSVILGLLLKFEC